MVSEVEEKIDQEKFEQIKKILEKFEKENPKEFVLASLTLQKENEDRIVKEALRIINKEEDLDSKEKEIIKGFVEKENLDSLLENKYFGDSLLHFTAHNNQYNNFKFLIEDVYSNNIEKLNKKNNFGSTSLHSCVKGIISRLSKGISVDWKLVELIISKGVDWDAEDKFKNTAADLIEEEIGHNYYDKYASIVESYLTSETA